MLVPPNTGAQVPARMPPRHQRGIAAIELALVLPLASALLLGTLWVGRLIFEMNVLKQATIEAAARLNNLPPARLRLLLQDESQALAVAGDAVHGRLAGAGVVPASQLLGVSLECSPVFCQGTKVPEVITVSARLRVGWCASTPMSSCDVQASSSTFYRFSDRSVMPTAATP